MSMLYPKWSELNEESCTYWFIKLVLPTPLSPRMMTCRGPGQRLRCYSERA